MRRGSDSILEEKVKNKIVAYVVQLWGIMLALPWKSHLQSASMNCEIADDRADPFQRQSGKP